MNSLSVSIPLSVGGVSGDLLRLTPIASESYVNQIAVSPLGLPFYRALGG